jgi:hypothetical protein
MAFSHHVLFLSLSSNLLVVGLMKADRDFTYHSSVLYTRALFLKTVFFRRRRQTLH